MLRPYCCCSRLLIALVRHNVCPVWFSFPHPLNELLSFCCFLFAFITIPLKRSTWWVTQKCSESFLFGLWVSWRFSSTEVWVWVTEVGHCCGVYGELTGFLTGDIISVGAVGSSNEGMRRWVGIPSNGRLTSGQRWLIQFTVGSIVHTQISLQNSSYIFFAVPIFVKPTPCVCQCISM